MNDGMYSSLTGQWDTPSELVETLSESFAWDIDVCASGPNVCENFFDESDDGLAQDWNGTVWMNPPYGRKIGKWIDKARVEFAIGHADLIVMLVPARTDTAWWHRAVEAAAFIVEIKGRLKFGSTQSWIAKRELEIRTALLSSEHLPTLYATKNIGGKLCSHETKEKVARWVKDNGVDDAFLAAWKAKDNLNKGSAPFPSALVVIGVARDMETKRKTLRKVGRILYPEGRC
jgi:phage N-6-adenine-methyltransferase